MSTESDINFSLESTWHLSKVSCLRSMYFIHVILCYVIFLSGIGAMVSRLVPQIKWTHVWWGRLYIIAMLWNTFTSTMIHNTGLPINTIYLFCVLMCCIAVGWPIIMVHQNKMTDQAMKEVQASFTGRPFEGDLSQLVQSQKGKIAQRKSCKERMWSLKAAHGIMMFLSWGNIAGRIFASNQSGDFTCHTYPVYKPLNATIGATKGWGLGSKPLEFVPEVDPRYARLPWAATGEVGFTLLIDCSYLVMAAVFGCIYSWYQVKSNLPNGGSHVQMKEGSNTA